MHTNSEFRISFNFPVHAADEISLSPLQPKNGESVKELDGVIEKLIDCLYDSMTECIYQHPITSFTVEVKPQPVFEVDILGKGRAALERANNDLGETLAVSKDLLSNIQL